MNLLIVSNSERHTFTTICDCVIKMPRQVNWKIMGNSKFHQQLISLFGNDRFIDIPIPKLHEHHQEENKPFDFLERIPEKHIIIPTDYESLKFLSKNRKNISRHNVYPIMEPSMLSYLDDKLNLEKIAAECQVISPKEYQSTAELEKLTPSHRLVVKPHLGDGSKGVFISRNKQEAIDYYEQLTPEKKQQQIIQDYIDGEDLYYYGICYEGKIQVSGIIRPGQSKHVGTYFVDNPAVDKNAKKIMERYQYTGPISIDYRIDKKTKEVYLIEINPRNGANFYLFNVANTNWIYELARVSENPDSYLKTHKIFLNKWLCMWRIGLLYFFYKLKVYKIRTLI